MWKNLKYPRGLITCGYTGVYKTLRQLWTLLLEEEEWTVSSLLQPRKDNYMFIIYVYTRNKNMTKRHGNRESDTQRKESKVLALSSESSANTDCIL